MLEEDLHSAKTLRDMLTIKGLEVSVCGSVRNAEFQLRNNAFDAILTEMTFSGISGPQVVNHIRKQLGEKPIPIIVTSAHSDRHVVLACAKHGIADLIVKPIKKDYLLNRLRQVI